MTQEELNEIIERSGLEPDDREQIINLYSDARREAREAAEAAEASTRAGIARYREAVLAANPDLPAAGLSRGSQFDGLSGESKLAAALAARRAS